MKKALKSLATIVMLGAMCFLGGEWPEDTPRKKVVWCDAGAFATMVVCGLYIGKNEKEGRK